MNNLGGKTKAHLIIPQLFTELFTEVAESCDRPTFVAAWLRALYRELSQGQLDDGILANLTPFLVSPCKCVPIITDAKNPDDDDHQSWGSIFDLGWIELCP
jgi:hypothetical protein